MVKNSTVNKIKIFSAIILIICAIAIYIILHGTKDLIIVKKVNQLFKIIPIKNGIKIHQKFITGYLVDILWFNSFCLLFSVIKQKKIFLIIILIACILEFIQLINPTFGTFDCIDLLIYILSGSGYYIYEKNKNEHRLEENRRTSSLSI